MKEIQVDADETAMVCCLELVSAKGLSCMASHIRYLFGRVPIHCQLCVDPADRARHLFVRDEESVPFSVGRLVAEPTKVA